MKIPCSTCEKEKNIFEGYLWFTQRVIISNQLYFLPNTRSQELQIIKDQNEWQEHHFTHWHPSLLWQLFLKLLWLLHFCIVEPNIVIDWEGLSWLSLESRVEECQEWPEIIATKGRGWENTARLWNKMIFRTDPIAFLKTFPFRPILNTRIFVLLCSPPLSVMLMLPTCILKRGEMENSGQISQF